MNEPIGKYIRVILSRAWILLILAAASAAIVYFNGDRLFEKKYEADMKVIITLSNTDVSDISVYDSLRSSQMAVGDVSQIISSEAVLAKVEKECGVDREAIGRALKIDSIPNTRIMDIGIRADSPAGALKLVGSLERNLAVSLKEIDGNIAFKILSRPYTDGIPVNGTYPVLFSIVAAMGGVLIGALINLILGRKSLLQNSLNRVHSLFEGENILLVPTCRIHRQDGGVV